MIWTEEERSALNPTHREADWTGMSRVVRPTLVIAIGGTGTAAAKAAPARIEHFVGPRHHYVAFRAFDTAFQDNREPRLVDNSEYVLSRRFECPERDCGHRLGGSLPPLGQKFGCRRG